MNFQTILEELDRLYEEDLKKAKKEEVEVEEGILGAIPTAAVAVANALTEGEQDNLEESVVDAAVAGAKAGSGIIGAAISELTESDEEEVAEEEVAEDEADLEEVKLVLECSKCGGLVIKAEPDIVIDEETDLADIEEICKYCEEANGYVIVGTLAPYAAEVPVEEEPAEEEVPAEEMPDTDEADTEMEELGEFLDADVYLNLDGGEGNDVSVLGRPNAAK